ncbi:MAG: dimethyl sulfoxide reductase anchor subunit [Rubrivivax sp.]|nr:dimethyl sulfoxide reductase anchor subunit [Rubrivivax sp.]
MNPAWSVILLTTLCGAAQGLLLVLYGAELAGYAGRGGTGPGFFALGGAAAFALALAALAASFFHLGRPERAWRAAAMWRTSWLSREVIVLPLFLAGALGWAFGHWTGAGWTRPVGAAAAVVAVLLFLCTAMIYASIRFIQEWASGWTLVNYTLIGLASGATLAAALAGARAPALVPALTALALALTLVAGATRGAALARNARLVPRSTLQTAIGVRHPTIRQRAMGFMGGSFNTREFFHGRGPGTLRWVRWVMLGTGVVLPAALLAFVLVFEGPAVTNQWLLAAALLVQGLGLLAERWYFFAQARHPQNLYYQAVS